MKNKIKSVWFYDEVYKGNILFVIGDKDEFKKYIHNEYKIELDVDGRHTGRCYDIPGYGIIIWMRNFNRSPKYYGVLVHEIIHATFFILENKFIPTADNSEPFNYHCEFLMRKFLEIYNKR